MIQPSLARRLPWPLILLCLSGAITGAAVVRVRASHQSAIARRPSSSGSLPLPTAGSFVREVAVFLGSNECYACRIAGVGDRVRFMLDSLRRDAAVRQVPFSALGIAVDGAPLDGVKWLQQYGRFEEVAVGGNWYNTAVLRFVWSNPQTTAGIPQIIVLRQNVVVDKEHIRVGADSVVRRWLGARAIAPGIRVRGELRGNGIADR